MLDTGLYEAAYLSSQQGRLIKRKSAIEEGPQLKWQPQCVFKFVKVNRFRSGYLIPSLRIEINNLDALPSP